MGILFLIDHENNPGKKNTKFHHYFSVCILIILSDIFDVLFKNINTSIPE